MGRGVHGSRGSGRRSVRFPRIDADLYEGARARSSPPCRHYYPFGIHGGVRALFKLTDQNDQTWNSTQWGEGVTHTVSGQGRLCGPGYIHAYTDPLIAVLLNPIHAAIRTPHLWEGEGKVSCDDRGLKVGCRTFTTLRRIPLPTFTTEQLVWLSVSCAPELYREPGFVRWARCWLEGTGRSAEGAMNAMVQASSTAAGEMAACAACAAALWASPEAVLRAFPKSVRMDPEAAAARVAVAAAWVTSTMLCLSTLDLVGFARRLLGEAAGWSGGRGNANNS